MSHLERLFSHVISHVISPFGTTRNEIFCQIWNSSSWGLNSEHVFSSLDVQQQMVFLVRKDLKMEKGKIAAQCGHATLACYKAARKFQRKVVERWEHRGQTKIALKVNDDTELETIMVSAPMIARTSDDVLCKKDAVKSSTPLYFSVHFSLHVCS